ncbi:MAG TPA: hypothetical protein VGD59_08910 [Acidisarcina sp.]
MLPQQLTAASFAGYPPQARSVALAQLPLLQQLPLVLVPILLRELIAYDWKLPAERRQLDKQFTYLQGLSAAERDAALESFRGLPLKTQLAEMDWVGNPSQFMEQLTAFLWSTHQMDRFREIADAYTSAVNKSVPDQAPESPRLGIVVIGAGVVRFDQPLFRKLRPAGVYFDSVVADEGFSTLLSEASRRAAAPFPAAPTQQSIAAQQREVRSALNLKSSPVSTFDHWYIDGATPLPNPNLTQVSYAGLEQPRARLLARIQQAINSGGMGPEELRSLLARMKPEDIGLGTPGVEEILNHFKLSLMTEGSGTQIFATTFVQWASRECVRRAQPQTLLVRYAPRQQAETMNAMLSGAPPTGTDPEGSLIDADLGAYYTWLNMRRLTGADQLGFLAWFEEHSQAIAIGPGLPGGTTSDSRMHMDQILALLG